MAFFILTLALFTSLAWAVDVPLKDCEALISRYDKLEIASVAKSRRNGVITVEVNGRLLDKVGLQDPQFITARSICADLQKSGITLDEIPEEIRLLHKKIEQAAQQKVEIEEVEKRQAAAQEQRARQEAERAAARKSQLEQRPTQPQADSLSAITEENVPVNNAVCEALSGVVLIRTGRAGEFVGLMNSGMQQEAARCCVACMVSRGTKILITDRGWQTSTVRVLEGPSYGCTGDLSGKEIGKCRWP